MAVSRPGRGPGPGRRLVIIAAYVAVYWAVLPGVLVAAGLSVDGALGLDARPSPWGFGAVVPGLALMLWAAIELRRRGRGLPISALPPVRLVTTGPYRLMRHPMYAGWNAAVFGLGLLIGSPGLALVVAPALAPGWIGYALLEERGLARRFGGGYRRYKKRVGLLPWVSLYWVSQLLVLAGALPVSVQGSEHIPKKGPALLVPNHVCYLDPAFVGRATRRVIWFTTTAEAFRAGPLAFVLRRMPAVPLRRYRPDPAACREVMRLLEEGELVCIFPEGERSPHGGRQAPSPQASSMIARLGVPVIPIVMVGGADVGPRWANVLRRRPVVVRVGPPLTLTEEGAVSQIVEAWDRLSPERDEPVRLAGLDRAKLSRILWRCPACGNEGAFRPAALACEACGSRWRPTDGGFLADSTGAVTTLAGLARAVLAFPDPPPLRARARGYVERSMSGPIRPLDPLGEGELRIDACGLSFDGLNVPPVDIRSVTSERADTLQVATAAGMWQFRPRDKSVFRLKNALDQWRGPAISTHAPTPDILDATGS